MPSLFKRLSATIKSFWRFFIESFYLAYGTWKILRLPRPMVTIFGGSKIHLDHPYSLQARALAQKLIDNNISVLTGGGAGIMQAAECGVQESKNRDIVRSIGVGVRGIDEEPLTVCIPEIIFMNYFFSRKWLLTYYSEAFVVFPGGFGTLDELAEISTLIQTKKLVEEPIILIGKSYWAPLLQWINESALKEGLLKERDKNLIRVTDDVEEALRIAVERCRESMN